MRGSEVLAKNPANPSSAIQGYNRAKEFLLSGELLSAQKAADIGLVNHCLPAEELDEKVQEYCNKLLNGSRNAIRWTKVLVNLELKRIATAVMDAGIAYEAVSQRSADHREGIDALKEKRRPVFKPANEQ